MLDLKNIFSESFEKNNKMVFAYFVKKHDLDLDLDLDVPWAYRPLGPTTCVIIFFYWPRSCARWLSSQERRPHHSMISPSHSLQGLPLLDFPSILENTMCFNNRVLFILQI